MLKQRRKIIKLISFVFVLLILIPLFGVGMGGKAYADTDLSGYSDVLDDLKKDESFSLEDYPAKSGDYSLQVIQIAESKANELFVYVYQPAVNVYELTATEIRLSQSIGENFAPKDFKLSLLSRNGVFYKYLVNDLVVKKDIVRYYDLICIFRPWCSDIDKSTGSDNVVNSVQYEVAKLYTVCTVNGVVTYSCEVEEVITITDKYVDFLRYYDGWSWSGFDYTHSHYVAFSADMKIDELYEADIFFVTRYAKGSDINYTIEINNLNLSQEWEYEEAVENYAYITCDDVVSNSVSGIFADKHLRDRIQTVSSFVATENLTDETLKNLECKQWVLRFYESDFGYARGSGSSWKDYSYKTEVSSVSILRLKFKSNGKVYNLGVVDNKQSGDDKPGNVNPKFDFWQWLADLLGIPVWAVKLIVYGVFALLVLAISLPILSAIFPVVGQFLKALLTGLLSVFKYLFIGLWYVISSPVRLIALIVRKCRGE